MWGSGAGGRKQSPARARVSELRGYGKQHWQAALGVGGLAQRDEQDEASHGEHSCLWWGTVRALPGMGMPGKPTNSSWGISVLEKTLHIWVSPRLLLMLPVQETAKLGDFRGRAEIMASVCVAACVLKSGFIGARNTLCAMGKAKDTQGVQTGLSIYPQRIFFSDGVAEAWGIPSVPGCLCQGGN